MRTAACARASFAAAHNNNPDSLAARRSGHGRLWHAADHGGSDECGVAGGGDTRRPVSRRAGRQSVVTSRPAPTRPSFRLPKCPCNVTVTLDPWKHSSPGWPL